MLELFLYEYLRASSENIDARRCKFNSSAKAEGATVEQHGGIHSPTRRFTAFQGQPPFSMACPFSLLSPWSMVQFMVSEITQVPSWPFDSSPLRVSLPITPSHLHRRG